MGDEAVVVGDSGDGQQLPLVVVLRHRSCVHDERVPGLEKDRAPQVLTSLSLSPVAPLVRGASVGVLGSRG